MQRLKIIIWILKGLIKSIYVNIRILPIRQAIYLPIVVDYSTRLESLRGRFIIDSKPRFAMIRFGAIGTGLFSNRDIKPTLEIRGIVRFEENAFMGKSFMLSVDYNGFIYIKKNFTNSALGTIICNQNIEIGENFLSSWNTLIMDTDYHRVKNIANNELSNKNSPILIGNNVWIGCGVTIIKGSIIADGCIIAANTLISGKYTEKNCLLAGNVAMVKKRDITLYRI